VAADTLTVMRSAPPPAGDTAAALAAVLRALVRQSARQPERRMSPTQAAAEIRSLLGWLIVGRPDQAPTLLRAFDEAQARPMLVDGQALTLLWRWTDCAHEVHGMVDLSGPDGDRLAEVLRALAEGAPVEWVGAYGA
jgi:hypothetical protein